MHAASLTILVIDDDENDLFFTLSAFQAAKIAAKVQCASGGLEGLAYLKGKGKYADRAAFPYPDFVITDLKMPRADGFSILTYLKEDPKAAYIRVVVFSGSSNIDDVKKCYQLGALSYHIKPSNPDALRGLIKALSDYWMTCEMPLTEEGGEARAPETNAKLKTNLSCR